MTTATRDGVLGVLDILDQRHYDLLLRIRRTPEQAEQETTGSAYNGHALGSVRDAVAQQNGISTQKAREVIRVAEQAGEVILLGSGSAVKVLDAERHARNVAAHEEAKARREAAITRLNEVLGGIGTVTPNTYGGGLSISTEVLEYMHRNLLV